MSSYLPPHIVHSEALEQGLGIPAGWSAKNSGVRQRRYVSTESCAFMAAQAIEKVLTQTALQLADIDLLISASATFDYPLPNQASVIKSELPDGNNVHLPCIDMDTTCLSFVSAFDMASQLLDGKRYRRILIASAEIASKGLNPKDWETATLFGDAAVAAVLAYDPTGQSGVIQADMQTYSEGVFQTIVRGGGHAYSFRDYPYDPDLHSFHMEGMKLLRLAKKWIPVFMERFFEDLDTGLSELDLIVPHQASRVGVQIFRSLYDLRDEQVYSNLEMHGNCIAASIPLALCQAIEEGRLLRGQHCLISGTSAGFAIGGVLFRY